MIHETIPSPIFDKLDRERALYEHSVHAYSYVHKVQLSPCRLCKPISGLCRCSPLCPTLAPHRYFCLCFFVVRSILYHTHHWSYVVSVQSSFPVTQTDFLRHSQRSTTTQWFCEFGWTLTIRHSASIRSSDRKLRWKLRRDDFTIISSAAL